MGIFPKIKDVGLFCKRYRLTEEQFYGKASILSLYVDCEEIPDGFSPVVNVCFSLPNVKKLPKGFNPVVGGNLALSSLEEIPEGFNPVVGQHLYLESVRELPVGFSLVVGGYLFLNSVQELPQGFNPVVGGNLRLDSVRELPKGFAPVVGRCVVHREKWDPTYRTSIPMMSWRDGKYIEVDGIFTEVVSHRKGVYRVKLMGREEITYIVTDGVRYAHGVTLAKARDSLKFKIGDRDTSKYKNLPITHKMTAQQTIECYRVITGACEFGVRDFIQRKFGGKTKKSYTIAEVIKFTEGEYGHQMFKNFFVK